MSWTDERITTLKKMWGEGKTAAEIAKALGDVTRNAVIGKAHRLKLSNRVSPIQQNKKPAASAPAAPKAPPQPSMEKRVRAILEQDIDRKGVPMTALGPRMCRWPLGDPKDENFSFCGYNSVEGLPYCPDHAKVAYQTGRTRVLQAEDFEEKPAAVSEEDVQVVKVATAG